MAYIYFCGATGKCFRGRDAENKEWRTCEEPERPTDVPEGETEKTWLACLQCPMRLEGYRENNDEPYNLVQITKGKRSVVHTWPVAGGGLNKHMLLCNRLQAGEFLRVRRQ